MSVISMLSTHNMLACQQRNGFDHENSKPFAQRCGMAFVHPRYDVLENKLIRRSIWRCRILIYTNLSQIYPS